MAKKSQAAYTNRKKRRYAQYENDCLVATNKTMVNPFKNPMAQTFSRAMELLVNDGTVLDLHGLTTLATMTEDILHATGTSIFGINWNPPRASENYIGPLGINWDQKSMKEFSLLAIQNKDEGIDNPNIFDPDIQNLVPKLISVDDKFIDKCDPFYEQDEETPELRKNDIVRKRHINSLKLAPVVDKLCMLYMNSNSNMKGKQQVINKYLNSKDKKTNAMRRKY